MFRSRSGWVALGVAALVWVLVAATSPEAQVTIPYSFTSGTVADPDQVNSNFNTLGTAALNRTGGTLTGNLSADTNITIDGADISDYLDGSGNITAPGTLGVTGASTLAALSATTGTFSSTLGVTGTSSLGAVNVSGALDVAAGAEFGSGNVALVDASGRIPALSTTYLASVAGGNLTGLNATQLTTGTVPDARLTGATLTSNTIVNYAEEAAADSIAAGTLAVDLDDANHFTVSLNANVTTFTVANVPASGTAATVTFIFTADGTQRTITWPSGTVWSGGVAPTMSDGASEVDIITLYTVDGGTTWYGFIGGQDFS